MAVITPAVAGPYDLGTVVIRTALNVNPETAQIHAVSDPIPNVFGGVKLDIRSIEVNLDRSKFMLNPTNCAAQATSGVLNGGGADPANPAAFSSYSVSAPFQATECDKLGFKPKLFTRLYGPTTRAKNPRIRAILEAPAGDANLSRSALTLPHALFLDQSHIKTVCTRPQLAAQECPQSVDLRPGRSEDAAAQQPAEGPRLPGGRRPQAARPGRRPARPGEHPGARSARLPGRRDQDRFLPDAGRSGEQVHPQHGRRQEEPPGQLDQPLREAVGLILNMKGQNGKQVVNKSLPLKVSGCKK